MYRKSGTRCALRVELISLVHEDPPGTTMIITNGSCTPAPIGHEDHAARALVGNWHFAMVS